MALGHSDNCPSGTQTLGQLSELHLDTRTAVRVTLKHLYSRPKYFGQGPKWFARACASRWLDNSKRRDVKRTEASLHGLLFRQVHKPIPSRRRALTAVVRGLVRAESGLGSGLGSAGRPAPTHHPLRLTPVTSSLTVRGVQMASSALVPSTNDDPAWPKPAAFSPPTKDAPNKKLITQTMTDVLVQQKLDHLSKGKDCWPRPRENIFALCTVLCGLNNPMCAIPGPRPRPMSACYVSSDSVQTRKINTFTHRYQEKYTRKIIPGKA